VRCLLAAVALVVALPLLGAVNAKKRSPAPRELLVTLDVKNEEVRTVLRSLQKQCGIRNLVIDPDVQGSGGTFYFRDVPCSVAFRAVFHSFGLAGSIEPGSMVAVRGPVR
jgi:hypothetical protein